MAEQKRGRPVLLEFSTGEIKALEVRPLAEGGFAMIDGARWRTVGTVDEERVELEGMSRKKWVARNLLGEPSIADSKKAAATALIEQLSWYQVRDLDTIPGLF